MVYNSPDDVSLCGKGEQQSATFSTTRITMKSSMCYYIIDININGLNSRTCNCLLLYVLKPERNILVEYFCDLLSDITDPRPGHDFGKVKTFSFDYSYWSHTGVSILIVGLLIPVFPELWQVCKFTTSPVCRLRVALSFGIICLFRYDII